MNVSARKVLVLGGPDTGKTTLLVQLHGRLSAGGGSLVARDAPTSLAPIEEGYRRLQQGVPVAHTARGTDVRLDLPATARSGEHIDIVVPDYAGEDLRRLVVERRLPERWHVEAVDSDSWLLMIRLAKYAVVPDVLSRPIGELARAALEDPPGEPHGLPVDMWSVELLQALLYARQRDGHAPLPALTLVLSCWDELDEDEQRATPVGVAGARLSLLDSYCRSTWGDRYRVLGLSSQGRPLSDGAPAEEFLDHGPQQMGWIVLSDGAKDSDLTLLVDHRQ